MFLVVKTFGSNNRNVKKKVGSKDVYNVDIRTPGNYTYWAFKPADAKDFKKRTYYGEIIGDNMVLCYILLMSESEAARNDAYDKGGASLGNPTRQSRELDPVIPLSVFRLCKEKSVSAAKKKEYRKAKERNHASQSSDIVAKLKEKERAKGGKGANSQQRDTATQKKDVSVPVVNNIDLTEVDMQETQTRGEATTSDSEDSPFGKRKVAASIENSKRLKTVDTCENSLVTTAACERCKSSSEIIETLSTKLSDAEETVDQLLFKVKSLEIELETSRKRSNILEIEKNAISEVLKSSSLNVSQKKESVKVESTNRHSSDSEEDDICILKRFSHMTYAKDKSRIDCKLGKTIAKSDIGDIMFNEKFSTRVLGLAELYWPNELNVMQLSDKQAENSKLKLIADCHIQSMTDILNCMEWEDNALVSAYKVNYPKKKYTIELIRKMVKPITVGLVRCQLRRITNNKRGARKVKAKSSEGSTSGRMVQKGSASPVAGHSVKSVVREEDKAPGDMKENEEEAKDEWNISGSGVNDESIISDGDSAKSVAGEDDTVPKDVIENEGPSKIAGDAHQESDFEESDSELIASTPKKTM